MGTVLVHVLLLDDRQLQDVVLRVHIFEVGGGILLGQPAAEVLLLSGTSEILR